MLSRQRFLALGQRIDEARRDPAMVAWSRAVGTAADPMDAAAQIADGVAIHADMGDPIAKAVLAAAIASSGTPCVVEGRCFDPLGLVVQEIDVLVGDGRGRWVPIGSPGRAREPAHVIRMEIR